MIEKVHHVLILCTHNSARSVLAEGMLNHWAGKLGRCVRSHSAGSAPSGRINPFALAALQKAGIDTSAYRSKSWDEFSAADAPPLSIVITVCDSAAGETCPVFFGNGGGGSSGSSGSGGNGSSGNGGERSPPVKVHWGYPDPSNTEGGDENKRRAFELTRLALGFRMLQLLQLPLDRMDPKSLKSALIEIGCS